MVFRWPIELDGLPFLKMMDLSMAMLNHQMVTDRSFLQIEVSRGGTQTLKRTLFMLRAPSLKSASPSLPDKGSRPPTDKMPNRPGAKRATARQAGVRSAVAMLIATPLEDSLESQRYV